MQDPPKLLVEWEPAWRSFADSLGVVLRFTRCPCEPLPVIFTGVPWRTPFASLVAHGTLALAWFVLFPLLWIPDPPALRLWRFDPAAFGRTIYYLAEALPRVNDRGGAAMGSAGKTGDGAAPNRRQAIRVVRGRQPKKLVADVPNPLSPSSERAASLMGLPTSGGALRKSDTPPAPAPAKPAAIQAPLMVKSGTLSLAATQPKATETAPPAPVLLSSQIPVELPAPTVAQPVLETASISPEPTPALPTKSEPAPAPAAPATEQPLPTRGIPAVVVSSNPGDQVGIIPRATGAVAVSPSGTGTGIGHEGSGGGIAVGEGTGIGERDSGPGSGKEGTGFGGDRAAAGGISLVRGPGGAGKSKEGGPAVPGGVLVTGNGYYIPTFGSRGPHGLPKELGVAPVIVVVATPHSGAALAPDVFRGHRFYTVYLDTKIGPAVMQFADLMPPTQGFQREPTPPIPIFTELPRSLKPSGTVVACLLTKEGRLEKFRVLKAVSDEIAGQTIEWLKQWRFRAAQREGDLIEVDAILGFVANMK